MTTIVAVDSSVLLAGEDLSLGHLLTLDDSGAAVLADPSFANDLFQLVGAAKQGALTGSSLLAALSGEIGPVLFGSALAASSNGSFVFLSATLGEGSLTPPLSSGNVVFVVGVLKGANGVTLTPDVLIQPSYISRRP